MNQLITGVIRTTLTPLWNWDFRENKRVGKNLRVVVVVVWCGSFGNLQVLGNRFPHIATDSHVHKTPKSLMRQCPNIKHFWHLYANNCLKEKFTEDKLQKHGCPTHLSATPGYRNKMLRSTRFVNHHKPCASPFPVFPSRQKPGSFARTSKGIAKFSSIALMFPN